MMIVPFHNLTIGVIGYSPKIVKSHVLPIIEKLENDGGNKIKERSLNRFQFEDGTEYIIINKPENVGGLFLDQLIIADDSRWMIYDAQIYIISYAKQSLKRSCVPEEFQIIEMQLF